MDSTRQVKILLADKLVDSVPAILVEDGFEVRNEPHLSSQDLEVSLTEIDIVVVRSTRITAEALKASSQLSLVIRAGAGVNTIDVATASALGVQVANCPGKNAAAVAELTIGLLVAADRRVVSACCDLRSGKWRKKEYGKSHGLKGRTLGLLGFGAIAQAVAKAALGLEMNVLAWSRSLTDEFAQSRGVERVSNPEEIAARSDAVSIHLAAAPETRHLVDAEFLAAMRESSILINTSRGELVDTSALRNAIETKKLRVGLDVYENEPAGGENDFTDQTLVEMVTGTPHIGASTAQTSEAIGAEVVRIVRAFVNTGHAPGAVNLGAKSAAHYQMVVRHYNRVGVLANVLSALREEDVNVEEMDNTIFEGGASAICCLRLDDRPSEKVIKALSEEEAVLQVVVGTEPETET